MHSRNQTSRRSRPLSYLWRSFLRHVLLLLRLLGPPPRLVMGQKKNLASIERICWRISQLAFCRCTQSLLVSDPLIFREGGETAAEHNLAHLFRTFSSQQDVDEVRERC